MNITVSVDEVTLETVVHEATEYGAGATVADMVTEAIVQRIVKDRAEWIGGFGKRVSEIRDEEIRKAVAPLIEAALSQPMRKTNGYGEPHGPETSLRQIIADEAKAIMTKPADQYNRSGRTMLQEMVAKEVTAALGAEVKDAVKQARELVSGQIGEQVAAAVKAGLSAR